MRTSNDNLALLLSTATVFLLSVVRRPPASLCRKHLHRMPEGNLITTVLRRNAPRASARQQSTVVTHATPLATPPNPAPLPPPPAPQAAAAPPASDSLMTSVSRSGRTRPSAPAPKRSAPVTSAHSPAKRKKSSHNEQVITSGLSMPVWIKALYSWLERTGKKSGVNDPGKTLEALMPQKGKPKAQAKEFLAAVLTHCDIPLPTDGDGDEIELDTALTLNLLVSDLKRTRDEHQVARSQLDVKAVRINYTENALRKTCLEKVLLTSALKAECAKSARLEQDLDVERDRHARTITTLRTLAARAARHNVDHGAAAANELAELLVLVKQCLDEVKS
ncbi:hypothetical protein PENSPDRAFT_733580 [Peniophora sp. CONT]|nr:hypothetical protein PENSPDRAFT_733580 [Peniophora sp. CONT]